MNGAQRLMDQARTCADMFTSPNPDDQIYPNQLLQNWTATTPFQRQLMVEISRSIANDQTFVTQALVECLNETLELEFVEQSRKGS